MTVLNSRIDDETQTAGLEAQGEWTRGQPDLGRLDPGNVKRLLL
jgi:hypothetical protein